MTQKERDRLVVMRELSEGKISQINAAKQLRITTRQVRHLLKVWKEEGDKGLISKKRGRRGNHCFPKEQKQRIIGILQNKLSGFGPTLAKEKLLEIWNIKASRETLRQWMMTEGLWFKKKRRVTVHKPRARRECFGELIQADGSHHHWFGEDGELTNLTVLIDDATSTITGLHFSPTETLEAYFVALEQHLVRYGRPLALYTDRSAVAEVRQGAGDTQFHKALKALDIELILANSPQAKGRVERANRTLQDRLVKELALRGIKTIEEANCYLPKFMEEYNRKFSKVAMKETDLHRSLEGYDLSVILRRQEVRTLLASCIFQYRNNFFEVKGLSTIRNNKGRKVLLVVETDGSFRAFVDGVARKVVLSPGNHKVVQPEVKSRKDLNGWKPSRSHPWKRWSPKYLSSKAHRVA